MSTEASAVKNGGYGYLDKNGIFKVVSTEVDAKKQSADGRVVGFAGPHAYGNPVVPTGTGEYDQLAITLHKDGSLTESEGFTIPSHIGKVVLELQ
ncbi:hypothetical protein [Paenibacillus sp. F4]|uniref:hypothetical protein n=1 Tax=Paenibacillus sp. F4 TaxID=357385 RepID=UPI000C9FD005|nr:hypothetical protein [Paenibacillus sp. F4]PNQ81944.1 hypothetical protein C1T21_06635 [Paenibacillus sp. F4]